ncbi:hypothetical protein K7432_003455 [Basidiobolus ranarum]|uniref:Uncharacterized protein n=1 Tax=Basidiobolus ranarum TaxID=34480 RepID=A0ABR2W6C2_9FUNG
MTKKTNFNSVFTKFLYETFPGDKSKQKDRNASQYSSQISESRFKLNPVFENQDYGVTVSEPPQRYDDHSLSRSSTMPQYPTVRDSSHGKKRYSIDSKLGDSSFLQQSSVDSQSLEKYSSQIISLEKDKRELMLDRKTWKKRCIRAETEQVTQASEFEEKARKLKERYDRDLEKLRLLHQERYETLSSQVAQLTQISEVYRRQLTQHGIEPRFLMDSNDDTLDEDREYIEYHYKKLGQKQNQDDELDSTVEYLIQALGYEFNGYRVDMCQNSIEQTKVYHELDRKLELATSIRKIRSRANQLVPKASNDVDSRAKILKPQRSYLHGGSIVEIPRIPSLVGLGRVSLGKAKGQQLFQKKSGQTRSITPRKSSTTTVIPRKKVFD